MQGLFRDWFGCTYICSIRVAVNAELFHVENATGTSKTCNKTNNRVCIHLYFMRGKEMLKPEQIERKTNWVAEISNGLHTPAKHELSYPSSLVQEKNRRASSSQKLTRIPNFKFTIQIEYCHCSMLTPFLLLFTYTPDYLNVTSFFAFTSAHYHNFEILSSFECDEFHYQYCRDCAYICARWMGNDGVIEICIDSNYLLDLYIHFYEASIFANRISTPRF